MVICDRSGRTYWASECQLEWNGDLVHKRHWEARHPQDFVRGVASNLRVDPARPDRSIANSNFIGPLVTDLLASAEVPDNDRHAPMGALGEFALGQAEETSSVTFSNTAGSPYIRVESTSGMTVADNIGIQLDDGNIFLTQILLILDSETLQVASSLPGPAAVGNLVTDFTATRTPNLG